MATLWRRDLEREREEGGEGEREEERKMINKLF